MKLVITKKALLDLVHERLREPVRGLTSVLVQKNFNSKNLHQLASWHNFAMRNELSIDEEGAICLTLADETIYIENLTVEDYGALIKTTDMDESMHLLAKLIFELVRGVLNTEVSYKTEYVSVNGRLEITISYEKVNNSAN